MNTITTYHIFVSSSSDLSQERMGIRSLIDDFSKKFARNHLIELRPFLHEIEVEGRLEPGKTPQQIIDEDLTKFESGQYRGVYLGMVWQRYGIPVSLDDPRSGTEYELDWALARQAAGQLIGVKFFVRPATRSEAVDAQQYDQVKAFIERRLDAKNGLYKQLFDSSSFKTVITNELHLTLRHQFVPDAINQITRKRTDALLSAKNFFEARPTANTAVSYIERAHTALTATSLHQYLVIQGIAGVGKSYLTTRLLADFDPNRLTGSTSAGSLFKPSWVWWIDADTQNDPQKVENQLVELARHLGITVSKADQALAELSEKLSGNEYAWLLVFDNALDSGSVEDLQAFRDTYFPQTSATKRIIITSQNTNWSRVLQHKLAMELDVWSADEFASFFGESASIAIDAEQDAEAIRSLHQTFGGLPIAAGLARSYMEEQSDSSPYVFRNYVTRIADEGEQMSRYTDRLVDKRGENLLLALTLTYRSISEDQVKMLFQLLCCFAPEDIPIVTIQRKVGQQKGPVAAEVIRFLPLLSDTRSLSNALASLRAYSLLSTDGMNYQYHRLLKDCLRFYLQEVEKTVLPYRQAEQLSALVFDYPNNVPSKDKIGFYDLMSTHIAEITAHTPDQAGDIIKATLYQRRAMYLFHKGRNPEAYELLEKAEGLWQVAEPDTLYWRINRLKAYLDHLESRATENLVQTLQKAIVYFDDLLKRADTPDDKIDLREDLSQTNSYIGILSERWGNWKTAEDAYQRNFDLAKVVYQEYSRYEDERQKKQAEFDKEYYMFHHHMGRLRWYERKYDDSIQAFATSLDKQALGGGKALTQMIYGAALGQASQSERSRNELTQVFDVIAASDEFRRIAYTAFYLISFAWDYKLADFDLNQYLPYIETKTIKVYDPKAKSRVEKLIADVNANDLKHQHIRRNIRLRQAVRSGNLAEANAAYAAINQQKFALKTLDELIACYHLGDLAELIRFNDEGTITESALLDYAQLLVESDADAAGKVVEQVSAITSYFAYHREDELVELSQRLGVARRKLS